MVEIINRILDNMDQEQLRETAGKLESLGHETRLGIFYRLIQAGPSGMPVGALQDDLNIPGSTLSHHLSQLVACKLVSQTREGRVLRCTANYGLMRDLLNLLGEECCIDDQEGADCLAR